MSWQRAKYTTLLAKELEKKEVQEGLIHACDVIDLIIEILRGSANVKMARACLTEGIIEGIAFKIGAVPKGRAEPAFYGAPGGCHLRDASVQADRTRDRGADERARGDLANIAEYNEILSNRAAMAKVIIRELEAYKKEYGRPRRTVH